MTAELLREAAAKLRDGASVEQPATAADVVGVWLGSRHHITISAQTATAAAAWLEAEAQRYDEYDALWQVSSLDPRNGWQERGLTVEANLEHHFGPSLAVARAYLGRTS